jgi:hypothetical protein
LANRLGLELRVAHYPPYCSKYNPIEHRVFPHITRACQGVIFHTLEVAKQFIERAKTSLGLRVSVSVLEKVYATGRKYAEGFKEASPFTPSCESRQCGCVKAGACGNLDQGIPSY